MTDLAKYLTEVPMTPKGNLACPFCGGVKLTRIESKKPTPEGKIVTWVHCDRCGATGPNTSDPNVGWNTRSFEERLYFRAQDEEAVQEFFGFLQRT